MASISNDEIMIQDDTWEFLRAFAGDFIGPDKRAVSGCFVSIPPELLAQFKDIVENLGSEIDASTIDFSNLTNAQADDIAQALPASDASTIDFSTLTDPQANDIAQALPASGVDFSTLTSAQANDIAQALPASGVDLSMLTAGEALDIAQALSSNLFAMQALAAAIVSQDASNTIFIDQSDGLLSENDSI